MSANNGTSFFVVGVNLDNGKPSEVVVKQDSSLEWAAKTRNKMRFDEGFDIQRIFVGKECVWNKEAKQYELPEGFE